MRGLQFNMLRAYDLTKSFLFVEDPGPEDIRTDVTLVPDPIPILILIGDVLEADRTHQNTVVEGAVVILQCPTGEGTLAAEYVIKAEYQQSNCCLHQCSPGYPQAEFDLLSCHWRIWECGRRCGKAISLLNSWALISWACNWQGSCRNSLKTVPLQVSVCR